jgi:hypothetical protein
MFFERSFEYFAEKPRRMPSISSESASSAYTPSEVMIRLSRFDSSAKRTVPASAAFRARRSAFQQMIVSTSPFPTAAIIRPNSSRPGFFADFASLKISGSRMPFFAHVSAAQ